MLGFVIASISQPYSSVKDEWENGSQKAPGQTIENPSRSVPPGDLLYSNPFTCPPYNGLASETWTDTEVAVDFVLGSSASVGIVRWWFFINPVDINGQDWIIRIYDDISCTPDALLGTWNITGPEVTAETYCSDFGYDAWDCWAYLNPAFSANAGQTYWVSVQAVVAEPDRGFWCSYGTQGQYNDCTGMWRSSFFGIPNWETTSNQGQDEFCFEVYGGQTVPFSNWALFLGIGLILVFTVVRFRKLV
jgi:hypothetical protein